MPTGNVKTPVPKVLIVCNSPDTGPAWAYCLQQKQIRVVLEASPANVVQRLTEETPDLILFDITRLSTGTFTSTKHQLKELRGETANPVLLLSSRQDEDYILEMYDAGVDEYIVKPISPAMFIAKIRAWLRRSWSVPVSFLNEVHVNKMHLHPEERMVEINDHGSIRLTNLELRLLHVMMTNAGKTVSAEELINRTWGYSGEADNTLLKNMIYRLRRKIEIDPANPQSILTMSGIGYKLVSN